METEHDCETSLTPCWVAELEHHCESGTSYYTLICGTDAISMGEEHCSKCCYCPGECERPAVEP